MPSEVTGATSPGIKLKEATAFFLQAAGAVMTGAMASSAACTIILYLIAHRSTPIISWPERIKVSCDAQQI
jgi:hypothetical protein